MAVGINKDFIDVLIVLAIIGVVFMVLNTIINIFPYRAMYLFFGMLYIILVFCSISANGLLSRELRKYQTSSKINTFCNQIQRDISYKNLEDGFCSSKYLPSGKTCRKVDLMFAWEDYIVNKTSITKS